VILIDPNLCTLMEASGSPFPAPNALFATVGPTGNFLYFTVNSDDQILIFSISLLATPVLTAQTAFAEPTHLTANAPISMLVSPNQSFLYTANNQSISIYAISPIDGSLTAALGSNTPFTPAPLFNPLLLSVDNTGTFLYVMGQGVDGVLGFKMDPTFGSLTLIGGSPFASGTATGVTDMVADPVLPVLYLVINGGINAYTIDTAGGGDLKTPAGAATFTTSSLNLVIANVQ
jgi:hypothetical protein